MIYPRIAPLLLSIAAGAAFAATASVDLSRAVIVVRTGELLPPERTAATVLQEEVEQRTGIRLPLDTAVPSGRPAILLSGSPAPVAGWPQSGGKPETRAEGYHLFVEASAAGAPLVRIQGADPRGALFGVGQFLRRVDWTKGGLSLNKAVDISTAPAYPIRGHQLGYRPQANSYDAWNVSQFERYIRELALFGANSIEAIPFQDERPAPVMKVPRREMNRAMSEICRRYGLDYWAWVPADFDLKDDAKRTRSLAQFDEFFRDCPELTGLFFPGGDPGNNPPELVLPFLTEVARRMRPVHPKARIWLSLQWFNAKQVDDIYAWLERESPDWMAGLVAGPSSPPIPETRRRLSSRYRLRLYPDITHNKICQYQVPGWDQAYALTLGREAINPRPMESAVIHNWFAPASDGFISYSDGIHDDVNKTIWSALAWDPFAHPRDILIDYARVFFSPSIAVEAADAILALERNWRGPLMANGAVESTRQTWASLESKAPQLAGNWRWQMCLLRADYDAYVRRRLISETRLEQQANAILEQARKRGSTAAMDTALTVLNEAVDQPVAPELRSRIEDLCERLFHSIGLQTSVERYFASGAERGAILDFVDYPLNNRWWLENEFRKVRAMANESDKVERLLAIAAWEHPGPGSFYDNVGNESKSPHVLRANADYEEPGSERRPEPTFWWWDQGKSRARLSWQATMWPKAMVYEGLDPAAAYEVRTSGYGQVLLRINGQRVVPTRDGREMGDIKEFPVPPTALKDHRLVLTFDRPEGEEHLNWRRQSRLSEVWLIRK